MSCKTHIFDFQLLQEWIATCGDYLGLVGKPFGKLGFGKIWGCNQSNWEDTFETWGILQFYMSVIINIIAFLLLIFGISTNYFFSGLQNLAASIISSYLYAHLGWFGVVKQDGCLCCLCICFTHGPILVLILGLWLVFWSIVVIANAWTMVVLGPIGIVYMVLYIILAIPECYMGVACVQIWRIRSKQGGGGGGGNVIVIGSSNA